MLSGMSLPKSGAQMCPRVAMKVIQCYSKVYLKHCLSFFLVAVIKCPDKGSLDEKHAGRSHCSKRKDSGPFATHGCDTSHRSPC